MQETHPFDLDPLEAEKQGKMRREFFEGASKKLLDAHMDDRLDELEKLPRPEKLHRRVKVGRNQPCPCGSGRKFKKCCISKINRR